MTMKIFFLRNISCFTPTEFTMHQEEYAEDICWVSGTYFVKPKLDIPKDDSEKEKFMINYVQWIPVILLVQAGMFYTPLLVWKLFSGSSGVPVRKQIFSLIMKWFPV